METNKIEISWSSLWKIFAMLIFAVTLYYVRDILVMIFASIVLSSAIYSPIKYLERHGIPKIISVLSIFLVAVATFAFVIYELIPIALIQFNYLLSNISLIKSPILNNLGVSALVTQLASESNNIFNTMLNGGSSILGFFSNVLSNMFFIAGLVIISFYLSISKDGIEKFLKAILPDASEDRAIYLYRRTRKKLERWLSGQLILSLLVGLLTFIGLTIIGSQYSILLAILAAILELIPYVGPIVIGSIAFLLTLSQSLTSALIVVLVFFVIQQIEGNILTPIIMSRAANTDPIAVIISILAGFQIAGILGALLAVPTVIIIEEVVNDLYTKKKHNDA